MGINKTILKARQLIYWPSMNNQITNLIQNCYTCEKFQNSNPKETIINHELPSRPWQSIAADFFKFDDKDYLLIVDTFSKYPEIVCLKNDTTSSNVIKNLKNILARHGIPDVLYSDNGPQFISYQFQNFLKDWEITHIRSSPHYPQSNGLIERHIQTIKKLMKKAKEENKDIYKVLLEYRTTPIDKIIPSPAEILFGRKLKTLLPISEQLLNTPKNEFYKSQFKNKIIGSNSYYNKKAIDLKKMYKGDRIVIQQKDNTWTPGRIVKVDEDRPRAYKVMHDGSQEVLDRNRKFLKSYSNDSPRVNQKVWDKVFEEYYHPVNPVKHNINSNLDRNVQNNNDSDTPVITDTIPPTKTIPSRIMTNTETIARPVRIRNKPSYLKDYVT